jgi:hypothetical protein
MRRLRLPPWLRRSLEAALIGGGVAVISLLGTGLGQGGPAGPPVVLPTGPAGALVLAPALLAIGVVATTYPVAMAATRSDALLGAIAGFLLAADACVVLAAGPVSLPRSGVALGTGLLVGLLGALPAMVGVVGGQLAAPLGFGRRAGGWTALVAVIVGLVILAGIAALA